MRRAIVEKNAKFSKTLIFLYVRLAALEQKALKHFFFFAYELSRSLKERVESTERYR